MKILCNKHAKKIVCIFGLGTVGWAVYRELNRGENWTDLHLPYPWQTSYSATRIKTWEQLRAYIKQLNAKENFTVEIIWSAGKAGMFATESECQQEQTIFNEFTLYLEQYLASHNDLNVHLISSAGALYEGIRGIDETTTISPQRPYGFLKEYQEQRARTLNVKSLSIYRPTSVYSYFHANRRNGLIPTLVNNAIAGGESVIFGQMSTLRDYVWAEDIGRLIAQRVHSLVKRDIDVLLLASGVPTSVRSIITLIEQTIGRPILYRQATNLLTNASDTTVRANSFGLFKTSRNLSSVIRLLVDSSKTSAKT